MTEPYRDQHRMCPACSGALREYQTRLICDACQGMMVSIDDLKRAISELTGVDAPTIEYVDEKPGRRACPRCPATMTTHKLRVVLDDELAKPRPELDHCAEHGIWFDGEELAKVFEKVHAKVSKSMGTAGGFSASSGIRGVPTWWLA